MKLERPTGDLTTRKWGGNVNDRRPGKVTQNEDTR